MSDWLDGDIAECGVYRGGSAYLLAAMTSKILHLYDSFEGLPIPSIEDIPIGEEECHLKGGGFGIKDCYEIAKDTLCQFDGRIKIYKGWFSDTLRMSPDVKYAMVHLDVDLYQSYKECLEYFVPRITPGGFLVCDEYRFHLLPGAKKAIDEYFGDIEVFDYWFQDIQLTVRMPNGNG